MRGRHLGLGLGPGLGRALAGGASTRGPDPGVARPGGAEAGARGVLDGLRKGAPAIACHAIPFEIQTAGAR